MVEKDGVHHAPIQHAHTQVSLLDVALIGSSRTGNGEIVTPA